MGLRLGPGPVFVYEWLTATRRWQPYAMRTVFVWLMLIGMTIVQSDIPRSGPDRRVSLGDLAVFGEQLFRTVAAVELVLILLAAPAATAGAVCLDRARGTLDHTLVTDLSNAEIVLGKLAARLIPVLGLIASTLPVLALASLLGGIDPLALGGLFLVAVGCAVVGCSLAMTLSVYGRKTHEVAMLAYMIIIVWIAMPPVLEFVGVLLTGSPSGIVGRVVMDWIEWAHPSLAIEPYMNPGRVGPMSYLGFLAGCLLLSAALVGLATVRIRRVALKHAGRWAAGVRRRRSRLLRFLSLTWLPGPSLDANPVAWREWHRTRPSRMMRVAWGLYAAMGLLWVCLAMQPARRSIPPGEGPGVMNGIQVTVGLLLLSVGAATSLAEERARGSLDVLLSTPMPTRTILAGKWWGSFRPALGVAIWPAATTLFLAVRFGHWSHYLALLGLVLAYGAAITSLGLALAIWVGRLGRALALCVAAYVVFLIGWPILVSLCLGNSSDWHFARALLMMGDPIFGPYALTVGMARADAPFGAGQTLGDLIRGAFLWIPAFIGVAAVLFWVALISFDGCLGRIPDDGMRSPSRRPGRSSRSASELLALVPSSSEPYEADLEVEGK